VAKADMPMASSTHMVAMSSSELRTFSSDSQQKGVAGRQWRRQRLPVVQFEALIYRSKETNTITTAQLYGRATGRNPALYMNKALIERPEDKQGLPGEHSFKSRS